MGDNGTMNNLLQPPYPSTRGKGTLYEGGIRVPLIIAGPGVASPGRTNDPPVGAVDIFATIAEMAGINLASTIPANVVLDSRSLMAMVTNTVTVARDVYSELFGPNVVPAANTGRALGNAQYKLIQFSNGQQRFYDLANDPYESMNLLATGLNSVQQSNFYSLTMKLAGYSSAARPIITGSGYTNSQFTLTMQRATNLSYSLWRAPLLDELAWVPLSNAIVATNSLTSVSLTDISATNRANFYRVIANW